MPIGSHGVFLDARAFLPHLDQDVYPAQTLAAEIYLDSGVRTMKRGNVSSGRRPGDGGEPAAQARARTDHAAAAGLHAGADGCHRRGIVEVFQRREAISGLRMVYEPAQLRFFQARFEPLTAS